MTEARLENLAYDPSSAPRNEPLSYPGVWPTESVLISAEHVWALLDENSDPVWSSADQALRLSTCRVEVPDHTVTELGLSTAVQPHLVSVLEESFSVSVDPRVPVLAIGSNAAPSQLRSKFRASASSLMIPSVRARVSGLAVVYCSFVAPYGAVPATIVRDEHAELDLVVQLLDARQLAVIDRSESPRYRRVWLSDGVSVKLETGEVLPGVYAYVAEGGYLADDSAPLRMRIHGDERPGDYSQRELIEHVLAEAGVGEGFGATAEEFVQQAQADPDRTSRALTASRFTSPTNELFELPNEMSRPSKSYGGLMPEGLPLPNPLAPDETVAWCSGTPDGLNRNGLSVVRMHESDFTRLGSPRLLEIRSHRLSTLLGVRAPAALASVMVARDDAHSPPRPGIFQVDHVLRMATGLQNGQAVLARPAVLKRRTWPDRLFGNPTYLTTRVTLADPATAERDVALMSRLALDMLGIASGDYVIVEGAAGADGAVLSLQLKAFEAPEEVLEQREQVTGGTWGARFPSAQDAMGVHPDIPLVFLDSEIRWRLGVGGRMLASVRLRPSRKQQFFGELREVFVVLALTALGLTLALPDPVLGGTLSVALVVVSCVLMVNRMRRKLAHQLKWVGRARRK